MDTIDTLILLIMVIWVTWGLAKEHYNTKNRFD